MRRVGLILAVTVVAVSCVETHEIVEVMDISPRFSPDGSRIVFASDRAEPGSFDLYEVDLASDQVTRLTSTAGDELDPTYGPDGAAIIMVHAQSSALDCNLVVLEGDGGSTIDLDTHAAFPDVAVTGRIVLACDLDPAGGLDWAICVTEPDWSGTQILLNDPGATDWEPVWSPDGETIAFASDRDGDFDIYTVSRDGSDLQRITDNIDNDADPAWSPDGTRIAFRSDRDGTVAVWIMNTDGTGPWRLTEGSKPTWSPDGTRIAHHAGYRGKYTFGIGIGVTALDGSESILVGLPDGN